MKDESGCTPLMSVAKYLCHTEIPSEPSDPFSKHVLRVFRALAAEKRGGQFQETDNNNCTILHYVAACRTNFPFQEVTELALENQADPGMTDVDGEFPLTRAAYGSQDNVEFMRLLIPHMQRTQLEQSIYSGDTMLHYICKTKKAGAQELIADLLLPYVAECEKRDGEGRTLLSYAPRIISDETIASKLVEMAGNNANTCDDSGRNCIYWSCQMGSKTMVSALLDAGADIDATLGPGSKQGAAKNPPLLIAAAWKQFEVVEFLLEKKADPKVKGDDGWQLHHFAFCRDSQQLQNTVAGLRVFDYKAKVSLCFGFDCKGNRVLTADATPFHIAIMSGDENGLQWLLEEGKVEDISEGLGDGSSPLFLATINGNLKVCRTLIEAGTSISKSREDGLTAFHAACKYGHVEICKLIIANHENSILNKYGERTPLELAADEGQMDIVHFLLEQGCDTTVTAEVLARNSGHHEIGDLIRERHVHGKSAISESAVRELDTLRLQEAFKSPSADKLIRLLQEGADPNIRFKPGHQTPLHMAVWRGWQDSFEYLMHKGANLDSGDAIGTTPLMLATNLENWEYGKLLHQNGALIQERNSKGWSALHFAALRRKHEAIVYLLELGMDSNMQTHDGLTPLHLASGSTCVETIIQHGGDPFALTAAGRTVAWAFSCLDQGGDLQQIFATQPDDKVLESVNTIDRDFNSSPLYNSSFRGATGTAMALIDYDASVNFAGGFLGALIHASLKQGHFKLATMLLSKGARPYRLMQGGEERAVWFWEYGYAFSCQTSTGVWRPNQVEAMGRRDE